MIASDVRTYVLENYLFTDEQSELNNCDSFLEKGFLDSTGVLEIILFLEEKYEIEVASSEMVPENLDSVNNIVKFVENKKGI